MKKFNKLDESFFCENCGAEVDADADLTLKCEKVGNNYISGGKLYER